MTVLVSDLLYTTIPNGSVLVILILGITRIIISAYYKNGGEVVPDILGALGISSFLALLWLVSRGKWIGFGDAKLFLATSLVLGFPSSVAAFLFAFWLGGIYGAVLLVFGQSKPSRQVPFGPFILVGSALAYFYAETFWSATGLNMLPFLFK